MRSGVASLLVGLSLVIASSATAQDAPSSAYAPLLEEAVTEYAANHYSEARALFLRAHEVYPNARTLRGIGMASFELRDYVQALRSLSAALEHEVRPLTDAQRTEVTALMQRTGTFVGRYRITVAPAQSVLTVDGGPAVVEPDGSLLLDLGEHRLVVACDGCESARRTIEVRGGEDETLSLTASAVDPSSGGAAVGAGSSSTSPSSSVNTDTQGSGLPLFLAAGALAAVAIGGAVWWLGRGDELDRCEEAGEFCFNRDTLESQQTAALGVTIGAGVGAIGLAVVGLLTSGGDGESETRAASCAPALTGASCAFAF